MKFYDYLESALIRGINKVVYNRYGLSILSKISYGKGEMHLANI